MDEPSLAAEAPVPLKLIPMREVRKHRSPGDVWLVAFDLVIDVSSFAEVISPTWAPNMALTPARSIQFTMKC